MDFSRSRRCSRRKAARSDSSAHSASASGLTGPMRSRRRESRSTRSRSAACLGLVGRRREPGLVELLAHLVEAGGELRAAILQAGERHLDAGAPLAGVLELAAQLRLLVREPAQLAALQAGALLVADVELRDEARGVRPQGAGPRLHAPCTRRGPRGSPPAAARAPPGARGRRWRARRAASRRSAARAAAARRSSSSTRRRVTSASDSEWAASAWCERRLGVGGRRPQLLRLQQRARGGRVGRLLAGGRLGQLGGHALHGAPVALQVLLEVAPPGADLREAALGGLGGDARLALRRGRRVGRPRAPPPAARRRA